MDATRNREATVMKPTSTTIYAERPGALTDTQRGAIVAGLQQVATTSGLIKNNKVLQDLVTQIASIYAQVKPVADVRRACRGRCSDRSTQPLDSCHPAVPRSH